MGRVAVRSRGGGAVVSRWQATGVSRSARTFSKLLKSLSYDVPHLSNYLQTIFKTGVQNVGMAHIGVSVNDETKRKWSDYIESSDHGSMSELVRTAVRKEIRSDGGADLPREAERRINQIAENQERITRQMASLSDDFEEVSDAATAQYPEHIVELADDVAGELEEVPADRFGDLRAEAKDELRSLAIRVCDDPTKAGEVGEALDYLSENLSYIKTAPQGPNDYYRVRRD